MRKNLLIGLIILVGMGCSTHRVVPMADTSYSVSGAEYKQETETITQSLFNAKESTISEEDIQRLLNGKIKVPNKIRVAVLNLNSTLNHYNRYSMNNEEEMKLQRQNFDLLKEAMLTTDRTKRVFLMPNMVINKNPTLQQLREAAVRMQADMILIFHLKSDLYYKYKMFKKNEVKAFASCEALLMDIRTGVIPFSNVLTEDILIKKEEGDFNNEETRHRAISDATRKTLSGLGNELANYINTEL